MTNCILWGNTASIGNEIYNYSASYIPVISYCDITGCGGSGAGWDTSIGSDGGGNIDADPLFVDADGADNTHGTEDDDLHLMSYSPCIEAGDPGGDYSGQVDMDGEARVRYDNVDMGSDEVFPIAGDFEPDEDVDWLDLDYLCEHWLNTPCADPGWCEDADINWDGIVNLLDFACLAEHWLAGVE